MAIKTIIIRGRGIQKESTVKTAVITPGHLIQLNSDDTVSVHGSAASNTQKAFALENEVVGRDIDQTYAVGDNIIYSVLFNGSEVYALIADGVTATRGGYMESAGDGTLRPVAADAATDQDQRESCVAVALETVTASGAAARVRVAIV